MPAILTSLPRHNHHRIVLIHIPKCGGTSVTRALRQAYCPASREILSRLRGRLGYAYCSLGIESAIATAQTLELDLVTVQKTLLSYSMGVPRNGMIAGHIPFCQAAADAHDSQWHFVTILREPLDRFLSEYYYNRYKKSTVYKIEKDIEAYLNDEDAIRTSAQITNFLSGRTRIYTSPTIDDVTTAIRNLDRFAVIGFLDDLQTFADLLAERFGRRPAVPHINRSPVAQRPGIADLPAAVRARVKELCAADRQVWQQAQRFRCARPGRDE